MSQEVKVDRRIKFGSNANFIDNIYGNPSHRKIVFEDNFVGKLLDETNDYTTYKDGTNTVALSRNTAYGSGVSLTTSTTDTHTVSLAGNVAWYPSKNPILEMRFRIDVITTVAIFMGFNDETAEATTLLPFGLVTATLTDTATDAAGFLFDTRQSLSYFNIVNTKNGTDAFTQLASTKVPVAATSLTLRVAIDTSGNATYYWNGEAVGYKASAVTTTVGLCPYIGIRNNSGAAHVLVLERLKCWQDA